MQVITPESPTSIAAQNLYETLPDKIKAALRAYAEEMDYPMTSGRS